MKKVPYYVYLIIWISILALFYYSNSQTNYHNQWNNISRLSRIIILGIPLIVLFTQILKNKKKIFNYYKKIRIKFKHIFFTLESLPILFLILVITTVVSLGGFKNFQEKVMLEYFIYKGLPLCNSPSFNGMGNYEKFYFKSETQYLDYYKNKGEKIIELANILKDDLNYNFNHCYFSRVALKEAHKKNNIAKDILASQPPNVFLGYSFLGYFKDHFFTRYFKSIKEDRLYNPALKYNYTFFNELEKSKRKKLLKESGEEGYLLAMREYLSVVLDEFNKDKVINYSECKSILKYSNYLAEQNSALDKVSLIYALIGKLSSYTSRYIYYCSGKKTDFFNGITRFNKFYDDSGKTENDSFYNFKTTYPAIIYYNGWGNVKKNKIFALKLFQSNSNAKYPHKISFAYLALESFNNNDEKKALNYLKKMNDEKITDLDSLKIFIKKWIEDWFENPELFKTLTIYG